MRIKSLQGVKTTQAPSLSLEDWADLSLLSSLLYDMKHTHTYQNEDLSQMGWESDASHSSPIVLFIAKTKILECPCGLKGKLHLMKGSLVRLPLRCIRCHRTDCLLLVFHASSAMMPRSPSAVAPSPVLRQNWKTLARLASWWSKLPDVDACPHIIFICSSVLRHKPTNHSLFGIEAQTKKPSRWFCGPNHQIVAAGFEAQIGKPERVVLRPNHNNRSHRFWGQTRRNRQPWSVSWLSLKTKVVEGFPVWASKPVASVWWFGPQNHRDSFLVWVSKPSRLRFVSCATKPTEGGRRRTHIKI
jgi:hypothetical protein